jgi:hypothetical protein
VDHTVMEKLHVMEAEFRQNGRSLLITGLEQHKALSTHPLAARKKLGSAPAGSSAAVGRAVP